jgi:VanZ family protein
MLAIFIQSSFPAIELPKVELISADKLVHAGVFGLLAAFCFISLIHTSNPSVFSRKPLLWSPIISVLYAASDEIHQYFVPNRSAEVQDWAADVLGVIIAVLVIKYFLKNKYVLFGRTVTNDY